MKPQLKYISGDLYLIFPYASDADTWDFWIGTVLRRKRISFVNYMNGYKLI